MGPESSTERYGIRSTKDDLLQIISKWTGTSKGRVTNRQANPSNKHSIYNQPSGPSFF
ncbi:Hypothetical protein FKW44_002293 [Caligus rogercresseyi]|uniref:Uncharacterized protein n=1 Tax=Caligus rogercresseyi TaxID=217165 RepID=A0A7T8KK01_CALRO|nr:Hypothetical protein FKW44_002293 [Caligus rogercresseyi]